MQTPPGMSEADVRPLLRKALRTHMGELLSPQRVAQNISALAGTPAFGPNAPKPIMSKHTIRRFLEGPGEKTGQISSTSLEIIWLYLKHIGALPDALLVQEKPSDVIFASFAAFYDLDDRRIQISQREVEGCYEFYVKSEYRKGYKRKYLVQGAIRLQHEPETGALTAIEHQAFKSSPDQIEKWEGYFFIRDQTVIVVLRSIESAPKFYVLNRLPVNASQSQISTMQGRMVKVGLPSGVFTSRIVLRPNEDAFKNLDIIPHNKAPELIRDALDADDDDW